MKKKILIVVVAIIFLALPSVSSAQVSGSTVTSNTASNDFFYPSTYDNLVLDFTVNSTEDYDKILALTVKNKGTASSLFEIPLVRLWRDTGAVGWQGWGTDTRVAEATYSSNSWYFDNLQDLVIPADGLRLFVTIDIVGSVTTKKTVQFYVPELVDNEGNGVFDAGDQGVFTLSGLNGPTDQWVLNDNLQTINTQSYDIFSPEIFIDNLSDGQVLEGITNYTITGQARDQGRGYVKWAQIGIANGAGEMQWSNVDNKGADYSNWQYQWTDIEPGSYRIAVQARDDYSNETGEIHSFFVQVKEKAAPEQPATPELQNGILAREADGQPVYLIENGKKRLVDIIAIFNSWGYDWSDVITADISSYSLGNPLGFRDGYLIKADNESKVYVIADGQRRWITTGDVFEGLGYSWNKINVVSAEVVARHPEGDPLTKTYVHPDGTLFKYQTYPKVFLLENGIRRHIADEATFLGLGYHWDNIITLPDWEGYTPGPEITL